MKITLANLNIFHCINHIEKRYPLVMEIYLSDPEDNQNCLEGMLICKNCEKKYPVINGIAIIVNNLVQYCSQRVNIFGKWYSEVKSTKLKEFLKDLSQNIEKNNYDKNKYEDDSLYFQSYKWLNNENFESDKFLLLMRWKTKPSDIYKKLVSNVQYHPEGIALDLGCALGLSTFELAKKFSFVIGMDTSYSFIKGAKRRAKELSITNIEFIVSDILHFPFNNNRFDLVFGMNIIEFIPIETLLKNVHIVLKPHCTLVITSPYDFNREKVYDKNLNDQTVRQMIEKNGFEISQRTRKESFLPWILKINERTYLFYFLDLIEAKKLSKHKL